MVYHIIFNSGGRSYKLKLKKLKDAQIGKLIIHTYFNGEIHCRIIESEPEYLSEYTNLGRNWICEIIRSVKKKSC